MLASNALTTLERLKNFLGVKDMVPLEPSQPVPDIPLTPLEPPIGGQQPTPYANGPSQLPADIPMTPLEPSYTEYEMNLIFLINTASSIIEGYCRRKLGYQTYEEFLTGRDAVKLVLPQYPILELLALDITGNGSTESVDVSTVRVMTEQGILYRPNGGFPSNTLRASFMQPNFDQSAPNIFVQFTAGYILPKDATPDKPRTLPYDIELACFKVIANIMRDQAVNQGNGAQVIKSESLGDWSVSYDAEIKLNAEDYLSSLSPDVKNLLDKYRQSEFYV